MQRIIREIFRELFWITKDEDISISEEVPPEIIAGHANGEHPGPDFEDEFPLDADWWGDARSAWNKQVVAGIVPRVVDIAEARGLEDVDEFWIQHRVKRRFKHLRWMWRNGQPKMKGDGTMESEDEAMRRRDEGIDDRTRRARKVTRVESVSNIFTTS